MTVPFARLRSQYPSQWYAEVADTEEERRRQESSLRRLQASASADNPHRYLVQYDVLMRYAELILLVDGLRLGESPHRGMKALVLELLPHVRPDGLEMLISQRHRTKKHGDGVPESVLNQLESLLNDLKGCAISLGVHVS